MAFGNPGGNDTYVPALELSGNLTVAFSRNVQDYAINKYSRVTPVKIPVGPYLYFNPLDQTRMPNRPYGSRWAPGTVAPTGFHNTLGFEVRTYRTERYRESVTLDERSVQIANWDVQKKHTESLAQKLMTNRSYAMATLVTTAGTYPAANTATATALAGGVLSGGTTADPRIKVAFDEAAMVIQAGTNGTIRFGNLGVVMNAKTAQKLSRTREIREYMMQSQYAKDMVSYENQGLTRTNLYGLPPVLYGYKVVVEDLFWNVNNKGAAADASTAVFPDNVIVMFHKDGDSDTDAMNMNYSSFHQFVREDMVVEAFPDPRSRLLEFTVTDEFQAKDVAPVSAFLITGVFS